MQEEYRSGRREYNMHCSRERKTKRRETVPAGEMVKGSENTKREYQNINQPQSRPRQLTYLKFNHAPIACIPLALRTPPPTLLVPSKIWYTAVIGRTDATIETTSGSSLKRYAHFVRNTRNMMLESIVPEERTEMRKEMIKPCSINQTKHTSKYMPQLRQ